eukprot:288348_1
MASSLALGDWGYFLITISWLFSFITFMISAWATYLAISHYQIEKQIEKESIRKRGGSLTTASNSTQTKSQKFIYTFTLTITCMWLFTAINISDSVGLPHWIDNRNSGYDGWDEWWYNWEYSDKSYLTWNVLWALAKINLYLVYLYRVYSVFKGTKYNAKSAHYSMALVLLVIQFVFLGLWCWYYNISWSCCGVWADNQYDILTGITWSILCLDMVISLYLIYLFVACMKRVTVSYTISGNVNDLQKQIVSATARIFTLAMISLSCSIFYQIIFGIAITGEFVATDAHLTMYYFTFTWNISSAINVYCLFLSMSFTKQHYEKVCRCCDLKCLKCIQCIAMIGPVNGLCASKSSINRSNLKTEIMLHGDAPIGINTHHHHAPNAEQPNKPALKNNVSVSLIEDDYCQFTI